MENCCAHDAPAADGAYRRVLAVALALNALMFFVEGAAGVSADSSSLLADAVDFAGDAANYGLSLGALAIAPLWRSRAALSKGLAMTAYGVLVVAIAAWHAWRGDLPDAGTMGWIGFLALAVNLGVAVLLYRYRQGDADMRSVWLCTRNDAIGNLAVLAAAAGVFGAGAGWPDYLVAAVMAVLAIGSGSAVIRLARREILARRCALAS